MTTVINKIHSNNTSNSPVVDNKPKAKVWLNIGFYHPTAKDKNGNPLKCCLNLGIALDTMKEGTYRENAPENMVTAITAGNLLREGLLSIADKMEAGSCKDLTKSTNLHIFLQKVNEEHIVDTNQRINNKTLISNILGTKEEDIPDEDDDDETPF